MSCAWESSKQNLYKLLGENLILSQSFDYKRESDELVRELTSVLDRHQNLGRVERNGYEFIRNFRAWYTEKYPIVHPDFDWGTGDFEKLPEEVEAQNEINNKIINGFINMINYYTLVTNIYEGESFEITLENGKPYKVSKGCKPVKALSKIADSFGIEGFEEFRICHSQVLNQKSLKGTITLSIHPFDYWTMSDNECGWDSCMNWRDNGGYRQGTVEMMNSPYIVVAYMESSEPMEVLRNYGENKEVLYWNSKKWRQLFIVNEDVILGIKSYPYNNDELSLTVMNWLKDLAEKNLGWTYYADEDNKPFRYTHPKISYSPKGMEEDKYRFDFYSNCMYTDVGCADWHPLYIGTTIKERYSKLTDGKYYVEMNYSGATQCISCGDCSPSLYDESSLCCERCDGSARCSECGSRLYEGEEIEFRGMTLCECCYDDFVGTCDCCEEEEWKNELCPISVILPVSDKIKEEMLRNYNRLVPNDCKLIPIFSSKITVCVDCLNKGAFTENFLNENGKIITYRDKNNFNEPTQFVLASDLNHYGRSFIPELEDFNSNDTIDWDEIWYDSYCYPKLVQPLPCEESEQ